MKKNGTTLDLVIPNGPHCLSLIHVVHNHLYKDVKVSEEDRLKIFMEYQHLKIKMKLAYESWMKNISLGELIQRAVFKTLVQKQRLAVFNLHKFLNPVYNCQHGLFDTVVDEAGRTIPLSK